MIRRKGLTALHLLQPHHPNLTGLTLLSSLCLKYTRSNLHLGFHLPGHSRLEFLWRSQVYCTSFLLPISSHTSFAPTGSPPTLVTSLSLMFKSPPKMTVLPGGRLVTTPRHCSSCFFLSSACSAVDSRWVLSKSIWTLPQWACTASKCRYILLPG